jgi:hypothetical protein
MLFHYDGDEECGQILSWFKLHLKAIGTCVDAGLPEACLTLVYSGIDTFGLLGADVSVQSANRDTFIAWCEKYILARILTIDGEPLMAIDLYSARCGILHTSTALSDLERNGVARQIWYQFGDKTGVDMMLNRPQIPLRLDVTNLAMAFKEGGIAFIQDLKKDQSRLQIADARAQHFLRWAKVVE